MKLVLHLLAADTENLIKIKKIVWYFLNCIDWPLQATNEVVTRVPKATQGEMQAAVDSCKKAFQSWSETTVLTRQAHMFKLQNLIREHLVSDAHPAGTRVQTTEPHQRTPGKDTLIKLLRFLNKPNKSRQKWVVTPIHQQWRIQDFPEGARTPKLDVLTFFCRKLYENERIWTPPP